MTWGAHRNNGGGAQNDWGAHGNNGGRAGGVADIPPGSAPADYTKHFVESAIARYETRGLDDTLAHYNREESVDGRSSRRLAAKMASAVRDVQYKDALLALAGDDADESEVRRELAL